MSRPRRVRDSIRVSALNLVLPRGEVGPGRLLLRRFALAVVLLVVAMLVVFAQRHGYRDASGKSIGMIDALYFATVSLSTTGYGDIVPVSLAARVVNILVITPLRLMFLIVFVGTTIEVLTSTVSQRARARRWRNHVKDHVVIVGYGIKGRAALAALLESGTPMSQVAVVDTDQSRVNRAADDGATAICGDASRTAVLDQVAVRRAARVVISTDRDDTNVLVALTVRQVNPQATVVASVRHAENAPLLRSAGVDSVVVSAEAAGRLLGMSALSPATGEVMADLLDAGTGLAITERVADADEPGTVFDPDRGIVIGVMRGGVLLNAQSGPVDVRAGDRLVIVHRVAEPEP